ncbi:hypothetical protein [Halococcus sp. PRR34]|uniref:hypothetical protein n=1 Tax=Halococcus sp. PRR34 TaxID=3020830 RepID=UPI00235E12AB|nr:hypothetical protein [Halococcus sp. PRR34]
MVQGLTTTELLLQFFSLFLPAILALVGSYALYSKKQTDKENALRSAIRTEIESAERLEHISSYVDNDGQGPKGDERPPVPSGLAAATSLYNSHSFELGLLDSRERESVVNYYSNVTILNDMIAAAQESELSDRELLSTEHNYLRWQLDRVRGLRKSALIRLDSDKVPEDTDFD